MEKPSEIVIRLCELGWIHGLHIEQRQTGVDTADTFAKITGDYGNEEGRWSTYRECLALVPGNNSVCHVREEFRRQVEDWRKFEQQNAKELAEYKRLREKFGDI